MELLLLLLVPVVLGLIAMSVSGGKITWKEFVLQETVLVVLITIAFFGSALARTADKEIWSGRIELKEKVKTSCCHSYSCNCQEVCNGSGNDRSCSTVCDTCYMHSHDYSYIAKTTNGETAYDNSCNSPSSSEPERYSQIVIGEPTAIEHSYTNYIKGNPDTILRRTSIDKEFAIPKYPRTYDLYRANRFILVGSGNSAQQWEEKLYSLNSDLGAKKQVNIIVVAVYEEDQLYFEKLKQEWLGGKKNDFIVVIGLRNTDDPEIIWANVMSWSDSEECKVLVKNRVIELRRFDGYKIIDIIGEEVESKYIRKEMKDFEYLKARIEPTGTVKILIFIIGTIASIALSLLFNKEEIL